MQVRLFVIAARADFNQKDNISLIESVCLHTLLRVCACTRLFVSERFDGCFICVCLAFYL